MVASFNPGREIRSGVFQELRMRNIKNQNNLIFQLKTFLLGQIPDARNSSSAIPKCTCIACGLVSIMSLFKLSFCPHAL